MRKAIDGFAIAIMIFVCVIWGTQQVAIKSVSADLPPVLQVALRSSVAAFLVWIVMLIRRETFKNIRDTLGPGLLVGLLFALEFLFVAEGLKHTSASHMSVFLYTAPAFAALGLQIFIPSERLARAQWGGIALAFVGILIAFLSGVNTAGNATVHTLLGDALGLLAGLSWGMTTVAIRCSSLNNAPASQTLFYQLFIASVVLFIYAYFSGQTHFSLSAASVTSLAYQAIVVAFVSYLVWFALLKKYLAAQLGVLSFMTPIFGVLAGFLLLNEDLTPGFISGSILILLGIVIVSGYEWFLKKIKRIVN